jgi:uncharacterized membrane protein YccC
VDSTPPDPAPTSGSPAAGGPGTRPGRSVHAWLTRRDPGLRATKRSVRAAVLVPLVFAIALYGTSGDQVPLFAVFGSVSLLLFCDFGGPLRVRARSYAVLWVVSAAFIVVGTLCSTHAAAAVVGMAVAAFGVLFAGVVSPQAVAASTAALLTFVLPVAERAPASAVPDRLAGWILAGVLCIPAALFVWAGRWHDRLRHALAVAARSLAALTGDAATAGGSTTDHAAADRALAALRAQYEATPYRPTGAGPTDVALTNLVSRLEWVGSRVRVATAQPPPAAERDRVVAVERAASEVLDALADLLSVPDPDAHPDRVLRLRSAVSRLEVARDRATDAALATLLDRASDPVGGGVDGVAGPGTALAQVDPTFPVRMLAFALEMLANVALDAMGAARTAGPVARARATLRSFARVAAGHLTFRSVWFRNSLRGAVGLALAVLVVEETTVQHGFWVVLGTLSVLRSNALGTGATAARAVLGTAIGFLGGYLVLLALGPHIVELWLVLPLAVLVAGITPTTISFTAGQAGFTVLVVVVFNIIDPVGYRIGLVRIEDVMIGAAVSVGVGLLFWPRGAAAALARAMGVAFATASAWLTAAVDGVARPGSVDGTPGGPVPSGPGRSPERTAALAAARRLDDAYRQYLAERGAKSVPQPVVTRLLTGTARVRLTASTLDGLPDLAVPGGPLPLPEVTAARATVVAECTTVEAWFDRFAASLGARSPSVPALPAASGRLDPELVAAWDAARSAGRRDGVIAVLRLLWVEERMEDLRHLQADLAGAVADAGDGSAPGIP